jgi:hypothetical protein
MEGSHVMSDIIDDLDRIDEETLAQEVSDEALEVASGALLGGGEARNTFNSWAHCTQTICC